ncbi:ribonuclease P protein component [Caldalkalibacillus thermarum]|uniref:ribonuclease P protein component n=1 Tax=Caldalkalibacillus thermarum TaxID=296745 RepID=UPI00166B61EB|nr:ribonuclease P protein component [Caldalkalibacillus thermarum]GGK33725.1 ribonuclease P protein component [Caldalkalibacillus thermarum]
MKKQYRLRKNQEFARVYRHGQSVANRQLVLFYLPNENVEHFRLGVSVSKKLGLAVVRNRLKRVVREAVRLKAKHIKQGYDLVIIVRKGALDADFEQLSKSFIHLLKKSKLYVK